MPGSKRSVVADAKDLNPFNVKLLRCKSQPLLRARATMLTRDPRRFRPEPGAERERAAAHTAVNTHTLGLCGGRGFGSYGGSVGSVAE
ncbi:hypothetical protein GCM10011610_11380 [Nocardia rhizosphaerihabitans]|uniref:Uncharacterized protein n=1 Tax=Nocardia rhizosphaerihabitans TaxID=1691570 RepID=A0ABQ2K5R1_9NOCA|nr:hypothetical protein GCM10011610_11380 [Nocardia rhizosphaerihabitans]